MCVCSPTLHFPPGLVPYVCRWAGGNAEKGEDRGGWGEGEERTGRSGGKKRGFVRSSSCDEIFEYETWVRFFMEMCVLNCRERGGNSRRRGK